MSQFLSSANFPNSIGWKKRLVRAEDEIPPSGPFAFLQSVTRFVKVKGHRGNVCASHPAAEGLYHAAAFLMWLFWCFVSFLVHINPSNIGIKMTSVVYSENQQYTSLPYHHVSVCTMVL